MGTVRNQIRRRQPDDVSIQLFTSFRWGVIAVFCIVVVSGCASGATCLREESRYVSVPKCLRMSNGVCAHWGSEMAYKTQCVEWTCKRGYVNNADGTCVKSNR